MSPSPELPPAAKKNIELIARVEQQLLRKRSPMERVGEAIARFFGSLYFVAAHAAFFTGWILVNLGKVGAVRPFDPYPFALLSLVVGIEFILLTTFVLINQKHQIRRGEQWSHLHLQLSMLTEQEVTKSMQMLTHISRHLGLDSLEKDAELTELAKPTPVSAFVGELERSRDAGATGGGPSAEAIAKVQEIEREVVQGTDDNEHAGAGAG